MSERRALVVGATGQLGPAICRHLRSLGFGLVLAARRPDPLTRLARGLRARALPWDITRDPALLLDLAGPVTLLVNAAVRAGFTFGPRVWLTSRTPHRGYPSESAGPIVSSAAIDAA